MKNLHIRRTLHETAQEMWKGIVFRKLAKPKQDAFSIITAQNILYGYILAGPTK